MQYQKPATTVDEQITLLKGRGMICNDEALVRRWLITVGYYRLSAYWLPYELAPPVAQTRSKTFAPGTEFEAIIDIYTFDRQLRLLVMEAIERVEIALRASWTHRLSLASGPHAHMDATLFVSGWSHAKRIAALADRALQSNEVFIAHYKDRYKVPYMPPLWAVTELMTFGELSQWVTATSDLKIGSAIAKEMGLPTRETLEGVIQALSYVRNICAHHGRLWNRRLVKRIPNIKRFGRDMSINIDGDQAQPDNQMYNILVVLMRLMLHQSPDTTFPHRVKALTLTRSDEQRQAMGFPGEWSNKPVWR
jgi:abortive infection bacteriophage resistance protein